jgi:hypothetical protein
MDAEINEFGTLYLTAKTNEEIIRLSKWIRDNKKAYKLLTERKTKKKIPAIVMAQIRGCYFL